MAHEATRPPTPLSRGRSHKHPGELDELTGGNAKSHSWWRRPHQRRDRRPVVISPLTAKTHVSNILRKLGCRDRAALVALAYESGLVARH
jgi:hypothetical protein